MAIFNTQIKGGGSAPAVINSLNVTPSTSAQTITATGGVDGYSPVNVSAVTSSIDANIVAGNIKNGVSILGVTGNYSGTTPSGTLNITTNGTYDVTNYASADVSVSGSGPDYYIALTKNNNDKLIKSNIIPSFFPCTDIDDYVFAYAYYKCTSFTSDQTADLRYFTTVNGNSACLSMFESSNIKSINLSGLTYVYGSNSFYQFAYSSGLQTLDISNLRQIGLSASDTKSSTFLRAFAGCYSLSSINLSNLIAIYHQYCFQAAFQSTGLTSVSFTSLTTIPKPGIFFQTFGSCSSLTSLSFPALTSTSFGSYTNQFQNMLSGVTGCTVHFPSNLQSVIGSWSDVLAGFSGTNTTVLFDLPATE